MIGIRGGRIVDPVSKKEEIADLLIRDGKIAAVGEPLDEEACERIIDARGLTVAPGLVDVHVHFRDPGLTYKEDILTGAAAAAAGGFTTVICMANTKPTVDNPETLAYVLEKGKETGIHVLSCAAVRDAGVCSGKGKRDGNSCVELRGSHKGTSGKGTDRHGGAETLRRRRLYG